MRRQFGARRLTQELIQSSIDGTEGANRRLLAEKRSLAISDLEQGAAQRLHAKSLDDGAIRREFLRYRRRRRDPLQQRRPRQPLRQCPRRDQSERIAARAVGPLVPQYRLDLVC